MKPIRFHAHFSRRWLFDDDLKQYPEGWIYRAWIPGLFIKITVYGSKAIQTETRRKTERQMRLWGMMK